MYDKTFRKFKNVPESSQKFHKDLYLVLESFKFSENISGISKKVSKSSKRESFTNS
jgi:hypothetical protein